MHRGRIHEANEWEKIVKLQKKEIKIFHWTTYTTQRGNS
jgi:hypothetical protein